MTASLNFFDMAVLLVAAFCLCASVLWWLVAVWCRIVLWLRLRGRTPRRPVPEWVRQASLRKGVR